MKYILLEYVILVGRTLPFSDVFHVETLGLEYPSLLHFSSFLSLLTGYLTGGLNNNNDNNNNTVIHWFIISWLCRIKALKVSIYGHIILFFGFVLFFSPTSSNKRQRSWKLKLLCRYHLFLGWEVPKHL